VGKEWDFKKITKKVLTVFEKAFYNTNHNLFNFKNIWINKVQWRDHSSEDLTVTESWWLVWISTGI